MQKHRLFSGALVLLPIVVASLSVLVALSGCGGSSAGTQFTLPETQQQQLGGVVQLNNFFNNFNPQNDDLNPPQTQQQPNCPQYTQITQGVYELDFGSGCQPYPGAPTYSGKIVVAQSPTGGTFRITFKNFNSGGGFVLNGSVAYSLNSNGSYDVAVDLTQTPASGVLQSCSVQFQFSGTFAPNNSGGYTLNGQGTQTTIVGNNTISYQIAYNNVSTGSGCNYPTSGSVTVQQLAPTGAPLGPPMTINYNTGQCGIAQVTFGSTTVTVNLANFPAPNPCQGAPRI
ncbi:MAG: hypothetical protein NZ874_09850 [Fimbriimonadales bacterium]|nr:hypothetical protein [Fimbriimonadales bacterium]